MDARQRGRGYSTPVTPTTHPLAPRVIAWPTELRRGPQHDDKKFRCEIQYGALYWQCGVCFGRLFWSSVWEAGETVFSVQSALESMPDSAGADTAPQ